MKLLNKFGPGFVITFVLAGCLATAARGANVLTPTGSLISARYAHTATPLSNGKVLVTAGGSDAMDLSSAELYNPTNGSFRFGFSNPSGVSYRLLASTNLAAPLNTRSNLGPATETSPGSGHFQFTDHQTPNYPRRFYRVSSP